MKEQQWPRTRIRRYGRCIGAVGLLWTALAVQGVQAGTLYDFEGIADNTSLVNQLMGLTFTDATVFTAGISLNDIDFPPHSGTNVVASGTTGGGTGTLSLVFSAPLSSFDAFFTFADPLTIQVFDAGSQLLGTFSSAASNVLGGWEKIAINLSGIASVSITGGSQFTLDDLTTQVPEPATLLLFAAGGLAGVGNARRWRPDGSKAGGWPWLSKSQS